MCEINEIKINLEEKTMHNVQSIASVLELTVEEIMKDLLESYVQVMEDKIKSTNENIFYYSI